VTAVWITIGALCAGTVVVKAAGPLAVGGRRLSGRTGAVIALVAPALLAALVVYETFAAEAGSGVALDARLAGLAGAAAGLALRLPILAVVALAALVTALVRLAT
jgi:Branched-chain amino acid transport protein (AzlD)